MYQAKTYHKLFQNAALWKFCFTLYSESSMNSEIKYKLLEILANMCLGIIGKERIIGLHSCFYGTWVSTSFCAFTSSMTPLNDSTLTYGEKWSLLHSKYYCVNIPL